MENASKNAIIDLFCGKAVAENLLDRRESLLLGMIPGPARAVYAAVA
jgi:hypothetical protein